MEGRRCRDENADGQIQSNIMGRAMEFFNLYPQFPNSFSYVKYSAFVFVKRFSFHQTFSVIYQEKASIPLKAEPAQHLNLRLVLYSEYARRSIINRCNTRLCRRSMNKNFIGHYNGSHKGS